jgi:hypothetical protein
VDPLRQGSRLPTPANKAYGKLDGTSGAAYVSGRARLVGNARRRPRGDPELPSPLDRSAPGIERLCATEGA